MNRQIKSKIKKAKSKKIISVFFCLFLNFYFLIVNTNAQSITSLVANAGNDTAVCQNDTAKIGGNPSATGGTLPYTFVWQPAAGLDLPNTENPNAFPSAPTTYTLMVIDAAGNSSSAVVFVSTYALPIVNAGADQTIIQGTNTSLQASGAVQYYWAPVQTLTNQNTATPTAEPGSTTTYCVAGIDNRGCVNADCMTVYVQPRGSLIFYNAFSPNGDGNNDVFYIGNLTSFPENKLEIYNRNGEMVYLASPYNNDWNGKNDGFELPSATYYYIFYTEEGKSKKQGAVTIIR